MLVEKPLAGTVTAAKELNALAASSNLKLQVGAMKRHDPGIEYARRSVARIGPVLTAQVWYRVMSALRPPTEATLFPKLVVDEAWRGVREEYKADREQYLLRTHGAHVFDGVRYLVGDVASLHADVARSGQDFSWHGTGRLVAVGWPGVLRDYGRCARPMGRRLRRLRRAWAPASALVLPFLQARERGQRVHRGGRGTGEPFVWRY